jgi:hypothetical protein
MWYSINRWQFVKRAKITFGPFAKGICYILECVEKKQKETAFNNFKKDILKA